MIAQTPPAIVRANGIELCYDTFGDASNPPLILIMGLAAQMVVWDDEFLRMLAGKGVYVIRFDNRDIGLSTKFSQARIPGVAEITLAAVTGLRFRLPYLLRDMAADTVGLMDALGIPAAHVAGLSMGGAIAQEIAIGFPQRIRSLISIMSTTGDPRLPRATSAATAMLVRKPQFEREAYLAGYVEAWHVLAGDVYPFDAARMRRQGERGYERGLNPHGVSRQLAAMVGSGNRTAKLRRLRLPTLVVHGSIDPLIPVAHGVATARAIPGAVFSL
ncbi:MAG TPA: alpha/beta fold hydrolase, partial [Candidatus Elarobacter sp.]